jgi:hypothetical protein
VTQSQAEAAAAGLKATMVKWGVKCSIELMSGRGTDPWGVYTKYHRMHHHTAATPYQPGGNLTPSLFICKFGRSDVTGPLCNGYGGYDLVYRIICMGEANHPGLGGPITIDGVSIPENSARKPTWGTEWEGGFQSWEEIDQLGPDMLQFMGRADCALAEWSRRPLTSQMEHKTWAPTRKVDRKDFDAARVRGIALSRKWFELAGDDDLAYSEEQIIDMVMRGVRRELRDDPQNTARQGILELVNRGVDERFSTGGSATRTQIAGDQTGDVTSLIELALQRSKSFQDLVAKVDALGQ